MSEAEFVFLPGTSGRGSFWAPVAEALGDVSATFLDWPGVGRVPTSSPVGGYDDLVATTIDHLGMPSVLVGQSMGGYVALRVAIERPDLVTHLVLAVTSGGLSRDVLGPQTWRDEMRTANPNDPPWLYDPQPSLDALVPSVRVPTLLVWADDDPISPLAVGYRLNELLPHSRLVVYESDDHWVARLHAVPVAEEIRRLVSGSAA